MELRDYLKLYWSQRWLIGTIMVIAAATAFIVASTQPVRYIASESFAVNRINSEPTADYQYDGYYALQAVDLYSKTVVSWFDTPSTISEMYTAAGVDAESTSINSLPARFRVKSYSSQNIVVKLTERTEERAQKVAAGVTTVLQDRTKALNQDPEGKPLFEVLGSTPVIAPTQPNPWIYATIALVLGFGLGLMVAAARHFLR